LLADFLVVFPGRGFGPGLTSVFAFCSVAARPTRSISIGNAASRARSRMADPSTEHHDQGCAGSVKPRLKFSQQLAL
jgi:hypothetical protein